MSNQSQDTIVGVLIGIVIVVAVAVGAVALLMIDWSGERGSGLPPQYNYDRSEYRKIDPALICYGQTAEIAVDFKKPRAVAVGLEDRIFVAGDGSVAVFGADGTRAEEIPVEDGPQCLAVGRDGHAHPGRLYVGVRDHVEVYDAGGEQLGTWESLGGRAVLTSIALAEKDVFVADAGNRIVWHYDTSGKLLGKIGERDGEHGSPGFIVPSAYFDCAMGPDGLLRVVNPGAHQIETYTTEGLFEKPLTWGEPTAGIEGFCGCCNPAAMAILPDGRIVTGEKGIPRVKVYGTLGKFECVVAGPDVLAATATIAEETRAPHRPEPVDLATDSQGRILVLDPSARRVRIFQYDEKHKAATGGRAPGEQQ